MSAIGMIIGGKRALVCGYGDMGTGCTFALRGSGACVFITKCDPICARMKAFLQNPHLPHSSLHPSWKFLQLWSST